MRYIITPAHIAFFRAHGYVVFEELCKIPSDCTAFFQNTTFNSAHNLFMQRTPLSHLPLSKLFAKIGSQLLGTAHLRLLFDQLFQKTIPLPETFSSPFALKDSSSFQGLSLLLLIRVAGESNEPVEKSADSEPLHSSLEAAGSGMFLSPNQLFDAHCYLQQAADTFLLIGYGDIHTVWRKKEKDPFLFFTSKRHQNGDRVKDKDCPLLV